MEFKVARNVIESVEFGKIYGFYYITGNFDLNLRAIGWLYQGAALGRYTNHVVFFVHFYPPPFPHRGFTWFLERPPPSLPKKTRGIFEK